MFTNIFWPPTHTQDLNKKKCFFYFFKKHPSVNFFRNIVLHLIYNFTFFREILFEQGRLAIVSVNYEVIGHHKTCLMGFCRLRRAIQVLITWFSQFKIHNFVFKSKIRPSLYRYYRKIATIWQYFDYFINIFVFKNVCVLKNLAFLPTECKNIKFDFVSKTLNMKNWHPLFDVI